MAKQELEENEIVSTEEEIVRISQNINSRSVEVGFSLFFIVAALVLYILNIESFLCLAVFVLGVTWNFFTSANKFLACILCVLTCFGYSLIAIQNGLFGHAFLHIGYYIPIQLSYFISKRNIEYSDVLIKKNKLLGVKEWMFLFFVMGVMFISFYYILNEIGAESFAVLDSASIILLMVSAFLINGQFRDYFIVRTFATTLAGTLWILLGIEYNWPEGAIMMSALFFVYAFMNIVQFVIWKFKIGDFKKHKIKKQPVSKKEPNQTTVFMAKQLDDYYKNKKDNKK